ncbi:MAG TPA: hypothetical protein DCZ95_04655 [Verrucomicrobia bacterium]|nr:hypothetical protein [Verrucomicrobiota bacterium]
MGKAKIFNAKDAKQEGSKLAKKNIARLCSADVSRSFIHKFCKNSEFLIRGASSNPGRSAPRMAKLPHGSSSLRLKGHAAGPKWT